MTDYLFLISQAKLAQYYNTPTDLPIRKYVLVTNMMKKTLQEKEKEEQWLDDCLGELDQQEYEDDDDEEEEDDDYDYEDYPSSIDNEDLEEMDEDIIEKTGLLNGSFPQDKEQFHQKITFINVIL
ncbi:hypothetical protein BJ944DRAFT_266448 [Cunninghamella echinulata]|nr:hypothetical protein BJ944DRAFT_266448 [Cunninghamella echinulata]